MKWHADKRKRTENKRDKRIRKTPTGSHVAQLVSSGTYIEYALYTGGGCGVPAIWIIRFEAEARMKYK